MLWCGNELNCKINIIYNTKLAKDRISNLETINEDKTLLILTHSGTVYSSLNDGFTFTNKREDFVNA